VVGFSFVAINKLIFDLYSALSIVVKEMSKFSIIFITLAFVCIAVAMPQPLPSSDVDKIAKPEDIQPVKLSEPGKYMNYYDYYENSDFSENSKADKSDEDKQPPAVNDPYQHDLQKNYFGLF